MIRRYYPGTNDPDPLPTDDMPRILQLGGAQTVILHAVPTFITIPKHPAPNANVYNEPDVNISERSSLLFDRVTIQ